MKGSFDMLKKIISVLLLTVTTGQGHNQAAKSLCDCFDAKGIENKYLDVFEYITN